MRRGIWLGASLALGMAAEAAAREPLPPLNVRDGAQPWTVAVRIDTRRFSAMTVLRGIFQPAPAGGETVLAYQAFGNQDAPFVVRTVSLRPQDLTVLANGTYYLAVVAEGQPRDPEAPRFRNQQLVHFKVEDGVPTRLTQAQYSALTDPVQVQEGPGGIAIRVQRGAGVAGPRPAPGPASADALERINTAGVPGSTTETAEK